jgi:hypothetical protein
VFLDTAGSDGTAVKRYDLSSAPLAPAMLWIDDLGPTSTPAFIGAPPRRAPSANGGTTASDNSFPRFAPAVGQFRGKPLDWISFRPGARTGLQVNATTQLAATSSQLWFMAVSSAAAPSSDPGLAPVWLPGQNSVQANPSDNHTPQWTKTVRVIR